MRGNQSHGRENWNRCWRSEWAEPDEQGGPHKTGGPEPPVSAELYADLFIDFITAPTIAVNIAPPPAPPTTLVSRPPIALAVAGSLSSLPSICPPAMPPIPPLRIFGSWPIAACDIPAPIA